MPSRAFFVFWPEKVVRRDVEGEACFNALAGIFCFLALLGARCISAPLPSFNALAGIFCFLADIARHHVRPRQELVSMPSRAFFVFWHYR